MVRRAVVALLLLLCCSAALYVAVGQGAEDELELSPEQTDEVEGLESNMIGSSIRWWSRARRLLAPTKSYFYWSSPLPLNRPVDYPPTAKYILPQGSQQALPKLYIPKGSTEPEFNKLQAKYRPHSFQRGRATYYGVDPAKGDSIDVGSCGYSYINKGEACGNNCLDIAAISDVNKQYPRSCGRCYEVGCQPATFTDGYSNLINRQKACRNPDQTLVVRITDTCPCVYPNNAFSNKRWCCGDGNGTVSHFDLSIQAFEKLAEPGLGVIGLRYRIVPCWYQPESIAPRPPIYHAPNKLPSWVENEHRGWNWSARVASWVTKQRLWPDPLGPGRGTKPKNVTGAGVTGYIPPHTLLIAGRR